ncbi:MAG TPA: HAD family hydrolase, partial [Candidatus Dormibacteraeota bacterium]
MADRWLTFDCFGTLIDWRHGIRTTGELLFPGRGEDFLNAYIALEPEVEEGPFKRYRAVLTETARRAAKQLSLDLKADDASALVSTIPHWPPFADVGPALAGLRKQGWKFALLTNCDRDIIALTQRRLPASFDAVVTAEDVSAYKPNPAHFKLFQSTFGSSAAAWIHVAQ